jgi:DNA-dependent RNA polymerase auxiliary subunit epsilon
MNTATIIGAPVLLIAVGSIAGYVGYLHSEKYRKLSVNGELQSQPNLAKEYLLDNNFSVTYLKDIVTGNCFAYMKETGLATVNCNTLFNIDIIRFASPLKSKE